MLPPRLRRLSADARLYASDGYLSGLKQMRCALPEETDTCPLEEPDICPVTGTDMCPVDLPPMRSAGTSCGGGSGGGSGGGGKVPLAARLLEGIAACSKSASHLPSVSSPMHSNAAPQPQ